MIDNIRKDYPIEMDIDFTSSKVSELNYEIENLNEDLDDYRATMQRMEDEDNATEKELADTKRAFAEYAVANGDTEKAHQLIGIDATIKIKLTDDEDLTNEEKEYIIKNI